jgi:hypothetical protein
MKIEPMEQPMTRSEFEHRFNVLENMIKNGRMSIAPHLSRSMEGLMNVRRLPNGRIDFLSVDEMARLHANTMSQMSKIGFPKDVDSDVHQ